MVSIFPRSLQPQTLAKLLTIGLFVLLCVQLTQWALVWFAQPKIALPMQNHLAQVEPLPNGALRSLFGGSSQAARTSNVQLKGVVALGESSGVAIVAVDGKPPEAVQVGRELAAGLKLVAVQAKSITLERNGVRETVRLPEAMPATSSAANAAPANALNGASNSAQVVQPSPQTNQAVNPVAPNASTNPVVASPGGMMPLEGNAVVPKFAPAPRP